VIIFQILHFGPQIIKKIQFNPNKFIKKLQIDPSNFPKIIIWPLKNFEICKLTPNFIFQIWPKKFEIYKSCPKNDDNKKKLLLHPNNNI